MFKVVKKIIKKILPEGILSKIKVLYFSRKLKRIQANHVKALEKIRKKEKVKVVFFLIHDSVWKYEGVYKLMEADERFEPIVIVCPCVNYGEEIMLHDMRKAFTVFKEKGYNVIKTLDEATGAWLDVKKEIKPDIVFFTNPYNLTKPQYYITCWKDSITFYVPYGFMITDRPQMQYNTLLHNLVFGFFYESKFQIEQAKKNASNKGINSIDVGFPGIDDLLFPGKVINNVWKNNDFKKIIWAPHHTIETENEVFNYSNFLEYYEIMFSIAEKYRNKVTFSFKPHPILKSKLYKHIEWGKEKTDEYYSRWKNISNGQLEEGEYLDLFLTSDAIIHDSGSFMVEYISMNKPALYMIRNSIIESGFSILGKAVLDSHYKSYNKQDLITFIEKVIINHEDPLKNQRLNLINNFLKPPNSKKASQNIMEYLKSII